MNFVNPRSAKSITSRVQRLTREIIKVGRKERKKANYIVSLSLQNPNLAASN